ncbi:signal peptidase I [Bacillus sp. FJAT-49736]|uniref:signal peptidase I n=1 Tax=Bacillus sp. FJAT-49736 TaxID=2833582 RepID=UPI001BC9423E|nr:signal peptidase I [Bacillus sp. FJAT-49736]MBS4174333.1 signal peptidase I [Bacillus sp. FJAT-49736]
MAQLGIAMDTKESTLPKKSTKSSIFSWIRFILLIVVIYGVLHYGVAIKMVSGNSMNPTLHDKGFMLVNKLFYTPERGDIVIVQDPDGFDIVKRIIGMPNDRISINKGIVYVNGKALQESYTKGTSMDMGEITVGDHSYFIMGDNRTPGESLDSRDPRLGPVTSDQIIGEVFLH